MSTEQTQIITESPAPAPVEPVYEYEVFNDYLDKYFQPLRTVNESVAINIAAYIEKQTGLLFQVRKVELGKEAIPPIAEVPSAISVHEARKLMAQHGQDVLVCVAWGKKAANVNIVTAGSTRLHSEQALVLGDQIAAGLGLRMSERVEDRREEHNG